MLTDETHKIRARKLVAENQLLAAQMSAMLEMLDNYYSTYTTNKRVVQGIVHDVMTEKASAEARKKFNKINKNQLNKYDNLDKLVDKSIKQLSKELDVFVDEPIIDELLDRLNEFWLAQVDIVGDKLTLK